MNVFISFLISQIEIITLILVLIKWKYQYKDYLFFKCYIIYGYVTDLIGHTLLNNKIHKVAIINYNVYILISTVLIVLFLSRLLSFKTLLISMILFIYFGIWLVDNIILNEIATTNSICRITSHALIIFLSFYTIKKRIEIYNFEIRNEPVFIILIGFCLNSLFRIIYEAIYLTSIPTKELNNAISILIPMINFTLYTFFIYSLICLKKPTKLISHY